MYIFIYNVGIRDHKSFVKCPTYKAILRMLHSFLSAQDSWKGSWGQNFSRGAVFFAREILYFYCIHRQISSITLW